jgi:hypothetical protein
LRRQTLVAIADCPNDIGENISTRFWILSSLSNVFMVMLNIFLLKFIFYDLLAMKYQLSVTTIILWFLGLSVLITFLLYVYYVYLVNLGGGGGGASSSKPGNSQEKI